MQAPPEGSAFRSQHELRERSGYHGQGRHLDGQPGHKARAEHHARDPPAVVLLARREIAGRHDQHQSPTPVGVLTGEGERRAGAGGNTDDGRAADTQVIQERRILGGLLIDAESRRHARMQIPGARGRYQPIAARREGCRHLQPLIEASGRTRRDEHRRAASQLRILDGAEGAHQDLAPARQPSARRAEIVCEAAPTPITARTAGIRAPSSNLLHPVRRGVSRLIVRSSPADPRLPEHPGVGPAAVAIGRIAQRSGLGCSMQGFTAGQYFCI